MTTIAYHKDFGLAVDRAVTGGDDFRYPDEKKVYELTERLYVAIAGVISLAQAAVVRLDHFAKNRNEPLTLDGGPLDLVRRFAVFVKDEQKHLEGVNPSDSFTLVLIDRRTPENVVTFCGRHEMMNIIQLDAARAFHAWGSGREFAMGAMGAGAVPIAAVRITGTLCGSSGSYADFIPIQKGDPA